MDSKYLVFIELTTGGRKKTLTWEVRSKRNIQLGWIVWYSPWRQYCFYPIAQTIFNIGCLSDIQKFIEIHKDDRK